MIAVANSGAIDSTSSFGEILSPGIGIVFVTSSREIRDDASRSAARPDITRTAGRLRAIPGRPLSAFEAPADECAFAPRCPHAQDVCRAGLPPVTELDGGLSRCVRAQELRGKLGEPANA